MLSFVTNIALIHIYIGDICYNIRVGKEKSNLQQLENLINFSAMKPKARYTFSGVESLSFTSHDVSVSFQDGDSLSVDFSRGQNGLKMVHEECRDFLKWYGKETWTAIKDFEALDELS
ncbi:MAG: hypothetical protein CM15mV71_060 [Caudoviricetes sp.]|nr:MAG: hypothetical protein CM15mV71_060 [Caudoviricetes sp.]